MDLIKKYVLDSSKLIKTNDHYEFIANIINDLMNKNFTLRLLFRGSRDGFTNAKFHELCDS